MDKHAPKQINIKKSKTIKKIALVGMILGIALAAIGSSGTALIIPIPGLIPPNAFPIPFNLPVVSGFLMAVGSLITHEVLGKKIAKAERIQENQKLEQLDDVIKNEVTPETMKEKETVKKAVKAKAVTKEVQSEDSLSK